MFSLDSANWNVLADFARKLGGKETSIKNAKEDFDELFAQWSKSWSEVREKYKSENLEKTLSWPNFCYWGTNLFCFFVLYLSGFHQAALRELRFYLEASARSYYVDSRHQKTTYNCKVSFLREVRWKKFRKLLDGLPNKKRKEPKVFYDSLCEYVHLSEETQTDALRDSELNLALNYPYYNEEKEMLRKSFKCSLYLLLESLEEKGITNI